jgi:hypothetical protein
MCPYCSHVLNGVTISHTAMECQYRRGMYCIICASYGHTNGDCPNKVAWAVRRGKRPTEKNLELRVTEQSLKDVLIQHGVTPGSTQLENKKLLYDLANTMKPLRLVLFVEA